MRFVQKVLGSSVRTVRPRLATRSEAGQAGLHALFEAEDRVVDRTDS